MKKALWCILLHFWLNYVTYCKPAQWIQYADMLSVFLDVSIMEGSGTAQHETEILFRNVEAKPESKAGMMS